MDWTATVSTYCLVASSRLVVGSPVTVTEVNPAKAVAVPPKETDVDPIVTDELVSEEFPILDNVFDAPLIETPFSVESKLPRFNTSEPMVTELLTRLLLPILDSVFADPLMDTPFSVKSVAPRLTASVPIVMELLTKLAFAILLKVLSEPLIVLLVSVCEPVNVTTDESMPIVLATDPSNVVPEFSCNPVPAVNAAVVVAVIVPEPPKATVMPL